MPDKQQLHQLVEQLPESEVSAAARYLEFLLAHEAPVDPEMLKRIDRLVRIRPRASLTEKCFENSGFELYLGACRALTCGVWTGIRR